MEAIRSMTIEEIIEHLKKISGAMREGFDECGRMIEEHPDDQRVRVAMEGLQKLCASVAGYLYDTFGIGPGVAGGPAMVSPGRRPFKWVSRAKLAEYWRCPAAGVSKKDLEALEADFASCCALRLSERAVAMKLNGPIIGTPRTEREK